jgi:hypothetical protein
MTEYRRRDRYSEQREKRTIQSGEPKVEFSGGIASRPGGHYAEEFLLHSFHMPMLMRKIPRIGIGNAKMPNAINPNPVAPLSFPFLRSVRAACPSD